MAKKTNPPKRLYLSVFSDGGVYDTERRVLWAYIVTDGKSIVQQEQGELPFGGDHWHNVELAESEAIFRACEFCNKFRSNYRLFTDSQAVVDKIQGRVNSNTNNPRIKAIQNILKEFKESPQPCSLSIQYQRRCSDKWSTAVHELTEI